MYDNNNKFEEIKQQITIRQVIEYYGFTPDRSDFICCPFHGEKTASLKIYDDTNSFYCFGCGIGGNIFNFVEHLKECSKYEAFQELAAVTGVQLHEERNRRKKKKQQTTPRPPTKSDLQLFFDKWLAETFRLLDKYKSILEVHQRLYAPISSQEAEEKGLHPLYVESVGSNYECLVWLLDTLVAGTSDEIENIYMNYQEVIKSYKDKLTAFENASADQPDTEFDFVKDNRRYI